MSVLKTFKTSELKNLTAIKSKPCISIFIPTSLSGRETLQGPIHLKNLLKEAEHELAALDFSNGATSLLLDPVRALVDDKAFWQHQNHGLAIFVADATLHVFGLPITVPAKQYVGERFDLTPLLPMLSNDGHFYILALSENQVRLIDATRYAFEEITVDGMPTSMDDAIPADDSEKQQQRHGGAGGSPTYFGSGSGGGSEDHKNALKRYFDRVDAALSPYLQKHPAPVVLAGVQYLLPIYRTANGSATILDGEIHGNKDRTSCDELHKEGWEAAAPHFSEAQCNAKDIYQELFSKGTASADAEEIGTAADTGRVATLFVATDSGSSPSLNRMVAATLANGGEVFALEQESMPSDQPVAATFRF